MVYFLSVFVILAIIFVLGSHKYEVKWQGGSKETICRTFFSVQNARVVTPGVPYTVEKFPSKTVITVDEYAQNFAIKVGKKFFRII